MSSFTKSHSKAFAYGDCTLPRNQKNKVENTKAFHTLCLKLTVIPSIGISNLVGNVGCVTVSCQTRTASIQCPPDVFAVRMECSCIALYGILGRSHKIGLPRIGHSETTPGVSDENLFYATNGAATTAQPYCAL